MLVENTSRVDLDPIAEANAYQVRVEKFEWDGKRIAEVAGVSVELVRARPRPDFGRLQGDQGVPADDDPRGASPSRPGPPNGNATWNVAPSPTALSTQARPPWSCAIWRTIGSPRPVPLM